MTALLKKYYLLLIGIIMIIISIIQIIYRVDVIREFIQGNSSKNLIILVETLIILCVGIILISIHNKKKHKKDETQEQE